MGMMRQIQYKVVLVQILALPSKAAGGRNRRQKVESQDPVGLRLEAGEEGWDSVAPKLFLCKCP